VLYVDTGCLLKLYYPEWNSAKVAAAAGEELCFCALHELEITTALQLKIFRGEATNEQATAALVAVKADVGAGKLVRVYCHWPGAFRQAQELARAHSARTGCRSQPLPVSRCAGSLILHAG